MRRALRRAVKIAGGQTGLGRIVGKRQSAARYWLTKGVLPAEHVLPIEAATGVSRHELRPDLYPREPVEPPAVAAERAA